MVFKAVIMMVLMVVMVLVVIELVDGRCNGHGDVTDRCVQVDDRSDGTLPVILLLLVS